MADQAAVVVFNKSLWKTPRIRRVGLTRWPRGALIKDPSEIREEQRFTVEDDSFLRKIGFLQKWPTHLLVENQDVCRLHYFNRGQVLVLDSTKSDWIYIVKSGSISVLQKIQDVKAKENDDSEQNWIISHGRRMRKSRASNRTRGGKNSPRLTYIDQMRLSPQMGNSISGIYNQIDCPGLINNDTINNDLHSKLEPQSPNKKQILTVQNDLRGNSPAPQDPKLPELMSQVLEGEQTQNENEAAILYETSASSEEILENSMKGKHKVREQKNSSDDKSCSVPESVFLLIQVLERGQNFGVSSLVFDDQPALSVISNGAECIMLSKKFYLQHASEYNIESLKRSVRVSFIDHSTLIGWGLAPLPVQNHFPGVLITKRCLQEYPYPSLQKMQENLHGYMMWVSYRADVYNEKVKLIETKRQKREQYLPQYTGQYSHRTGPR